MNRARSKTLAALLCAAWMMPNRGVAETCTVSVLNQSAPVRSDGSWLMPNVPSNMGEVRARVNCVEEGSLTTATSRRFAIRANGNGTLNPLGEDPPAPTPTRLEVTSPVTELTAAGQQVQVSVTAFFAGGASGDVSSPELGTRYFTSNPEIASIDAAGLLSAHASGAVLVVAIHEAIVDTVRVAVRLSGDSDGDGLPDDFETANGLDPGDPVDALEDADLDGLTNLAEYQLGTGVRDGDSDDDGLGDGREVNVLGTNPLLGDTDGDGLWDALEIQTGSNPLDPASFNLAQALSSIEIRPAAFVLIYNVVLGEASRQLSVLGQLIDGRAVDITRPLYGTTYESSNLQRVSFGPEPGRVYAGTAGAAVVAATNGSFEATTAIDVVVNAPVVLSSIGLSGYLNSLALAGDYAVVAAGAMGLYVIDVSDPEAPIVVSRFDTPGNANGVRVAGSVAVVADGASGIEWIDIMNPAAPELLGSVATGGDATDLQVSGSLVFVANGDEGLAIIDASDPSAPLVLSTLPLPGDARGVDLVSGHAVVSADTEGLHVVEVTDPTTPVLVSTLATRSDGTSHAADVLVHQDLAYVADGADVLGGFKVVSLREPSNPVVIAQSSDDFTVVALAVESGLAFGADHRFNAQIPIFSIGTSPPAMVAAPSVGGFIINGQDLASRGGLVYYISSRGESPRGVSGGTARFDILRYAYLGEDGVAPVVGLVSPPPGTTVRERASLVLRSLATDDLQIRHIEFIVNDEVIQPYPWRRDQAFYRVPKGSASLVVRARAYDLAGNIGESDPVTVSVIPDESPQIELLAPQDGATAAGGSTLVVAASASDDVGVALVRFTVGSRTFDDNLPPYRVETPLPVESGALLVSAIAFDSFQASDPAGPVTVTVDGDDPPSAVVLAPHDGDLVVEGSWLAFVGGASDDVRIDAVDFLLDGVLLSTDIRAPYVGGFPAPLAGDFSNLQIRARDSLGQETLSSAVVIEGIGDPGMTVIGSLETTGGTPIGLGTIHLSSSGPEITASADAAGLFEITGVPTFDGAISIWAEALVEGHSHEGALPGALEPLPGGTVEIGAIVLEPLGVGSLSDLHGRVLDELGQSVEDALVEVATYFERFVTTTDGDGLWSVVDVPATHGNLEVRARRDDAGTPRGGAVNGVPAIEGGPTDVGDLTLFELSSEADPGTTVVGSVELPDGGGPAAGVKVIVRTGSRLLTATTGSDGAFSLAGVPTLEGDIEASSGLSGQPAALGTSGFAVPNPGGITDLGTIQLARGSGTGV